MAFVRKSKQETYDLLTSLHPPPQSDYLRGRDDPLHDSIKRSVREVFGGEKWTDKDKYKVYAPSTKANYVKTRGKLGTFGVMLDILNDGLIDDCEFEEMERIKQLEADLIEALYKEGLTVKCNEEEKWDSEDCYYEPNAELKSAVEVTYAKLYDFVLEKAQSEECLVTLVSLQEALKVRTISKGPPLTYFCLKPVQKFLHSIMRKHPTFHLIGEMVTEKNINEFFNKNHEFDSMPDFVSAFAKFFSLDYRSATDLLDPLRSTQCVDAICDQVGLPLEIRLLFHKALTGHSIARSEFKWVKNEETGLKEKEEVVIIKPQLWGQLMGSIVSFIVLCLCNASVIRTSYEIAYEDYYGWVRGTAKFDLKEIPAVVNGDDGLVRTQLSGFMKIWESVAASAGFMPSLGKTYEHQLYANINSTSFLRDGDSDLRLVPYVNMGLVCGMGRSGGSTGVRDVIKEDNFDQSMDLTIGGRHHALMESCPVELIGSVHKAFLKKHASVLQTVRVPWYVPEKFGGVGLKPRHINEFWNVPWYRRIPVVLDDGHVCGMSEIEREAISLMLKGETIGLKKLPSNVPVASRKVWEPILRESDKNGVMDSCDSGFMDLVCFYLLPRALSVSGTERSALELCTKLRIPLGEEEDPLCALTTKYLRKNEKLWSLVYKRLPKTLTKSAEDKVDFEAVYVLD